MDCPLTTAFLTRLCTDLSQSSINNDLIEACLGLEQAAATDALEERVLFCCRVVLDRLAANLQGEHVAPLDSILALRHLPLEAVHASIVALEQLAMHLDIEVAEYKMGLERRDASQLAHEADLRQKRQVVAALGVLHNALKKDAGAVGKYFYAFMYRDLQDVEALMAWARALVEMKKHVE